MTRASLLVQNPLSRAEVLAGVPEFDGTVSFRENVYRSSRKSPTK